MFDYLYNHKFNPAYGPQSTTALLFENYFCMGNCRAVGERYDRRIRELLLHSLQTKTLQKNGLIIYLRLNCCKRMGNNLTFSSACGIGKLTDTVNFA